MNGNTTLNELYHYGVKNMKWGVRKDKKTKKNKSSIKKTDTNKRKKALKISSVAGSAPISSSNIQKKAKIGRDFLQNHINTNNNLALLNQHTQMAITNHQNMVNDHNMTVQLHNQYHMNMMTMPHMNMF